MGRCKTVLKNVLGKIVPLCLFFFAQPLFAEDNVSSALSSHVLNGHGWDIFPYIPEINLPEHFTVHLLMLFITTALIAIFYLAFSKKQVLKPKKTQIALESLILFVRDDIVYPVMGEERGRKWLPFYSTLFLFLLTANLIGLIPAFKTATGNINVTGALAIMVLILTFVVGFKEIGVKDFFKNLYPSGTGLGIGLFVAFLEFLSIFTKSMVLAIRLFANMFAGHMAILSFLVLIIIVSPFMGFVSVPFAAFTYLLEVLIDVLQALVFTLLSCIFISNASEHE
ncbi:MAG: F0F1 ATP synthase subunit A [Spirochaetales bacterium]|nr:F0F1 ATP synthase subunit A [Spirochaetales bacterium]